MQRQSLQAQIQTTQTATEETMNPRFETLEKQARKRLNRRIKQAKLILRNRCEIEDDSFSESIEEIIESAKWALHTLSCGNPNEWDRPSTPQEHKKMRDELPYESSRTAEDDFALEWKHYAEQYNVWLAAIAV